MMKDTWTHTHKMVTKKTQNINTDNQHTRLEEGLGFRIKFKKLKIK